MSTKDQNLEVDPSEKTAGGAYNPDEQKDKDKDEGGAEGKGKDGPAASSKGINPVQHSE